MSVAYEVKVKTIGMEDYASLGIWESASKLSEFVVQILSSPTTTMVSSIRIDVVEMED